MQLAGRVALITGAARGIGREIALAFAQAGADLALCDLRAEDLQETRRSAEALGRQVLTEATDVTQGEAVAALVHRVLDKFQRVDILVNNAGITRDALLVRMKEDDWDAVLAVNLKGAFLCTRAVAPVMMRQRSGRIVNLASVIGLMGNAGQTNYAASKAGLIGLTKSVAKELASRGITVNAIAPGFIETEMTQALSEDTKAHWCARIPMGCFGHPSDVAQAALFLASDAARYITGQVVQVDGGLAM